PMHDIGKVAIPDSILLKPGKLDDDEWEIMQRHAVYGYEIFKISQRPLLQAVATISHEHHEKWDGSGYPRGLKGEDIHIFGRITAIADVFDALASDRVYKKAWSFEKTVEFLKEQRGLHFDPKLVDLFLQHLDEIKTIWETLKD
ncbi:MAG: HD domain-containing phosphohydrolase, partial [Sulfurimonadaceae bacterium]|nr:HD domain-containing phosphohydrolase [Sulfurimonadaceae bacterium]